MSKEPELTVAVWLPDAVVVVYEPTGGEVAYNISLTFAEAVRLATDLLETANMLRSQPVDQGTPA